MSVRFRCQRALGPALGLLLAALAARPAAARPPGCDFNYPIAGTAGFANAQAARKTNASTYGAAAFAEKSTRRISETGDNRWGDSGLWGFVAAEANWTFGAAQVPVFCDDPRPPGGDSYGFDPVARWERKERVYSQPLDLYATNAALGFGLRQAGAFYSASVTQSVLGQRWLALPTQFMNIYPVAAAPLIGSSSRGDGVGSYSLDWIAGAWIDSPYIGGRVGYSGSKAELSPH